jgi:hypothetical protein
MEERHPGQNPEADRETRDPAQAQTARPGGCAKGGLEATEEDLRLMKEAEEHAAPFNEALKRAGFGDHKGVEGF